MDLETQNAFEVEIERLEKQLDEYKRKFEIMRKIAIHWRTLWGEVVEPIGKYSDMPKLIDEELARRLGEKVVNK